MYIFFIPTSLATFSTTSPSTFSRNPILLPPPSSFTSHFPCFPGQPLTALLSSLPFTSHFPCFPDQPLTALLSSLPFTSHFPCFPDQSLTALLSSLPFTSHFPCFPGQSLTALLSSLPFLTHPYNSHFFHLSIFLSTHIFPFLFPFSPIYSCSIYSYFLTIPVFPYRSFHTLPITIFSFSVSLQLLYTYITSICHTYIHI